MDSGDLVKASVMAMVESELVLGLVKAPALVKALDRLRSMALCHQSASSAYHCA